jgi:hypothetical protein
MSSYNTKRSQFVTKHAGPQPEGGWGPETAAWEARAAEARKLWEQLPDDHPDKTLRDDEDDPEHRDVFKRLLNDYEEVFYPIRGSDGAYWGDSKGRIFTTLRREIREASTFWPKAGQHMCVGLILHGKTGPKVLAATILSSVYGERPNENFIQHYLNNDTRNCRPENLYWWLRSSIIPREQFRLINNKLSSGMSYAELLEERPDLRTARGLAETFQRVYDTGRNIDDIPKVYMPVQPYITTHLYDRIGGNVIYTPKVLPDTDAGSGSEHLEDTNEQELHPDDPRVLKVEFMDGRTEILSDVRHAYDITEDYNS